MILKGDCIEVMKAMKPNSVDAIITDPPYGLEFMGKEWDKLWDKRNKDDQDNEGIKTFLRAGKNLTAYKAGIEMQLWHTQWLTEAYRVLKPGGSMLVMGGTRTSHRLACAIEDSGFIIKDTLMWLYGSGFPKAQDLGKMIDKRKGAERTEFETRPIAYPDSDCWGIPNKNSKQPQWGIGNKEKHKNQDGKGNVVISKPVTDLAKYWDGFKVGGIKPAYEPIIWAVKPPEGSYVDNVLKWGVGAVNVDECRVGVESHIVHGKEAGKFQPTGGATIKDYHEVKGRFPANIILSHHPECMQVGMKNIKPKTGGRHLKTDCGKAFYKVNVNKDTKPWADPDGFEQVESWDCHPDCAVRLLDEQSGELKSGKTTNKQTKDSIFGKRIMMAQNGSNGGASRFFYCAKASRSERNAGLEGMEEKSIQINEPHNSKTLDERYGMKAKNNHPTVKPIKLFEWLIKLVTREGQIVLDPFIGSGTTAIAAHNVERKCIGIEKEDEYLEIVKRRIKHCESQPKQMEMRI